MENFQFAHPVAISQGTLRVITLSAAQGCISINQQWAANQLHSPHSTAPCEWIMRRIRMRGCILMPARRPCKFNTLAQSIKRNRSPRKKRRGANVVASLRARKFLGMTSRKELALFCSYTEEEPAYGAPTEEVISVRWRSRIAFLSGGALDFGLRNQRVGLFCTRVTHLLISMCVEHSPGVNKRITLLSIYITTV